MNPQKDIVDIFKYGVEAVNPQKLIEGRIKVDREKLIIKTEGCEATINLESYTRIFIIGAGKATAKMARGIEQVLGKRISGGVISVKYGHTEKLSIIKTIEAGHPIPDKNSIRAGKEIAKLASEADRKTLVINLISGGASALLELPYGNNGEFSAKSYGLNQDSNLNNYFLSLRDIKLTTDALLRCGATIDEINCIRKHISGIKGGRLAELIYPGRCLSLILSDVIGDRIDSIGSGPTAPDNTTYGEALEIIKKYDIQKNIPDAVYSLLRKGARGEMPETPKKDHPAFFKTANIIIGSNYTAVMACEQKAKSFGYNTLVLSSHLIGEASEVAKLFFGISRDIIKHGFPVSRPGCIIGGGETTVTIRGNGKGGRNQEMALSFLCEYLQNFGEKNILARKSWREENTGIFFLSGGTDGNDGPTDAAGAVMSWNVVLETVNKSINPVDYLRNNDSYHFFEKTGGLIKTGPTNTNVCDVQILIVI